MKSKNVEGPFTPFCSERSEGVAVVKVKGQRIAEYREHRRDGFETANADKIFESTFRDQTGRR